MVFGLHSKARYVCIDVQFDTLYFIVVQKKGDFFEIDFSHKLILEGGVFEGSRVRTPGKVTDILLEIQKKFGTLPVLTSISEHFSYTTLLPGETYAAPSDIRNTLTAFLPHPSYVWTHTFLKNQRSYIALHASEKRACDSLYSLIKNTGLTSITMYPRALVLAEIPSLADVIVCDVARNQTGIFTTYNSHMVGFSLVSYGVNQVWEKVKKRFSLSDVEVSEVFSAYGTDALPRKEGHVVHGIVHTFLAPIVDEIQSLVLRRVEYGLDPSPVLFVVGVGAQYEGLVEDIMRMTRMNVGSINIWEGVMDFETYIPTIHKRDSYEYAGIAGLMHILKNGTNYQPFDL